MITFEVPGKPRGKGRPRFYNGRAITPADTASYENLVKLAYMNEGGELYEGPVHVYIDAYYPIPKSCTKKRRQAILAGEIKPTVKPDLDNVTKAVLDGLASVAFKDDVQVVGLEFHKKYADDPKLVITVKEV